MFSYESPYIRRVILCVNCNIHCMYCKVYCILITNEFHLEHNHIWNMIFSCVLLKYENYDNVYLQVSSHIKSMVVPKCKWSKALIKSYLSSSEHKGMTSADTVEVIINIFPHLSKVSHICNNCQHRHILLYLHSMLWYTPRFSICHNFIEESFNVEIYGWELFEFEFAT